MVFWNSFIRKVKNAISRREFEALEQKVNNDVVFKSMTKNTTITNTGNTILSAPIVNLTSRSGDLELRVDNTTKSITCGGARIVNVEAPRVANGVATKGYVDNIANTKANANDVYLKSQTYTRAEVDSRVNTKANANDVYLKSQTYTRAEIDNKDTTINNRFSNYVSKSADEVINGNKSFYRPLDMTGERIFNLGTPSSSNDAATKGYVDNNFYTKAQIDSQHNFSRHSTNGNIRHRVDLGGGVFLYSVEVDSIPSGVSNVWYETIEIQRDSGGGWYTYAPTQFVSGQRRYYFISNDSYTLNQRLNAVNIFYFKPNR